MHTADRPLHLFIRTPEQSVLCIVSVHLSMNVQVNYSTYCPDLDTIRFASVSLSRHHLSGRTLYKQTSLKREEYLTHCQAATSETELPQ